MKTILIAVATAPATTRPFSETRFDKASAGSPPPDWTCGITGRVTPHWTVEADMSAPSRPNVLKQSSRTARGAAHPWCVNKGVSIADRYVEAKFKSLDGKEDQAGGVVWRWKDRDNY